jgi:hypothetical protein
MPAVQEFFKYYDEDWENQAAKNLENYFGKILDKLKPSPNALEFMKNLQRLADSRRNSFRDQGLFEFVNTFPVSLDETDWEMNQNAEITRKENPRKREKISMREAVAAGCLYKNPHIIFKNKL